MFVVFFSVEEGFLCLCPLLDQLYTAEGTPHCCSLCDELWEQHEVQSESLRDVTITEPSISGESRVFPSRREMRRRVAVTVCSGVRGVLKPRAM